MNTINDRWQHSMFVIIVVKKQFYVKKGKLYIYIKKKFYVLVNFSPMFLILGLAMLSVYSL